jgi:hypothetical protein
VYSLLLGILLLGTQEAEVAKALAQQREEEARAAHARELEQLKATEVRQPVADFRCPVASMLAQARSWAKPG